MNPDGSGAVAPGARHTPRGERVSTVEVRRGILSAAVSSRALSGQSDPPSGLRPGVVPITNVSPDPGSQATGNGRCAEEKTDPQPGNPGAFVLEDSGDRSRLRRPGSGPKILRSEGARPMGSKFHEDERTVVHEDPTAGDARVWSDGDDAGAGVAGGLGLGR